MKKRIPVCIITVVTSLLFTTGLMAQETTEVTVKVSKDGKVVKDTTYQFDDSAEAKHAVKMMEEMSRDEKNILKYSYTVDSDSDKPSKKMVFISEDEEKTEIRELHGDSLVWVTEGEHDGEHVIVMKSGDGETFDILIDEDFEDGDDVKVELKEILEEHGGENVKVIVVKRDIDVDDDHDADIDEAHDHDEDIDKEVEVEVKKIVKKKSKKQ